MTKPGKPVEKVCVWMILATMLLFTFTGSAVPGIPMIVSGNVSVNGAPAPAGTMIKAMIGGEIKGSTTLSQPGIYGMTVEYKQGTVELYVNNIRAQNLSWTNDPQKLDLSVTIAGVSQTAATAANTVQSAGGQGAGTTSAATVVPSPKITVNVTDTIKTDAKTTPQGANTPGQVNSEETRTAQSPAVGAIAVVFITCLISRSIARRKNNEKR